MMQNIVQGLEEIADSVKKSSQPAAVTQAIQSLRKELAASKTDTSLKLLDEELEIWLKKLEVILKEPAGREGMVKHTKHWADRLRSLQ